MLCAVILAFPPTIGALRNALNAYRTAGSRTPSSRAGWRSGDTYQPGSAGPRTQYSLFEEVPQQPEPPRQCDPSELLSTAAAYRIGMVIPSPLAARIDLLVKLANTAGLRTTRQELVAAAILAATTDRSRLARQLHAYWHGTAADAAIAGQPAEAIFKWPEGRPPRFRRTARINRGNRSEPPPDRPLGRRVPAP